MEANMKEIGKMEMPKVGECLHLKIIQDMRAGGLKENITAKEFMSHLKRPNILEIGSMASFME